MTAAKCVRLADQREVVGVRRMDFGVSAAPPFDLGLSLRKGEGAGIMGVGPSRSQAVLAYRIAARCANQEWKRS